MDNDIDKYYELFNNYELSQKHKYSPDISTIRNILRKDNKSYISFRKSSTQYANKIFVKMYVFNKYNNVCNNCFSSKNLTIDHILSVKYCYQNELYGMCNSIGNLQLLCSSCNNKKSSK